MLLPRLGTTPISWGFVGGGRWGVDLSATRVLAEAAAVGVRGIEAGVPSFLPADTGAARALLDEHGLVAVAAPISGVFHEPSLLAGTLTAAETAATRLGALGGLVAMSVPKRGDLALGETPDASTWARLVDGLAQLDDVLARHGVVQALHPHVNSLIETAADMERLASTSSVGWTLDIAHVACGGMDPASFAAALGDRIRHVHVKDCHLELGTAMVHHQVPFDQAVSDGVFVALGDGDLDLPAIVAALPRTPWWIIEQDRALASEPAPGTGPITDVRRSLAYLEALLAA